MNPFRSLAVRGLTTVLSLTLALASAFTLTPAARAQDPRLANISTRAATGAGSAVLTAGFVIGPGANKQVLIRGVGPSLSTFGVTGTVANPILTVFNNAGVAVASNDDWITPVGPGAATMTELGAAFISVGAFAFSNSAGRDSAVLVTLAPGNYTAQVAGVGGTSGVALVEVYEMGATGGRLLNTSTRLNIAAGTTPIIGIVIAPGTGTRKLLVRAAGPALAGFGLTGTLADPSLKVTNSLGGVLASNDNWETPSDTRAADSNGLKAAFGVAGAFSFATGAKDAAVLIDLPPGNYGIQASGEGGTAGLALIEVYDLTQTNAPTVTLAATKPNSDETGQNPGEFTISRTGDTTLPLVVNYGVGGSAVNGVDYPALLGTVTIPAGAASVKIPLSPNPDVQADDDKDTVVLTLAAGAGYLIGTQNSGTVTIANSPATLYIATIRPTGTSVGGSTASGTATILLSASGTVAAVNVSFSNLSSAQVTAHLVIGSNEDYVFNLPNGQVSGSQWFFPPTGPYSSQALLDALKSGNIAVRIDSANFPGGELKGSFIQGTGTRTFVAPAAPPAVALTGVIATDAARFLTQATFGPKKSEIDALTGQSIDAWLTTQLAMSFTSHRTATVSDRTTFGGSQSFTNWNAIHPPNRQAGWWKNVLTAPDQLRQRMAFALSQILVVSDVSLGDDSRAEPLAAYYDILGNGAFGNFRTLLENVTLSPIMGEYLSSVRNSKPDPVTGQTPDENYAREVMQLFSIGLEQLNPDGTLALGTDGLPIATYNQTTITEMAKVFTGWSYPSSSATLTNFRTAGRNYFTPMMLYPIAHDDTAKNIAPVRATAIPAAQGGAADLKDALDALAFHSNTAPFMSKLLIQRFVTSNPSPGYVYRVAQVWEQQKNSTTQLAQVVRAILSDYEARSPAVSGSITYGKLKEPLLRLTGLLRTFSASSTSGRFLGYRNTVDGVPITGSTPIPATAAQINQAPNAFSGTRLEGVQGNFAQAALRSITVFNFYHPDYVLPGPLAAAGLVVPEFEITDDNYAISVPNALRTFVTATVPTTPAGPYAITLNTTYEQTLVSNPSALIDHLNMVLCAGSLSTAAKARITTALSSLAASTTTLDRVNTAILLVLTSPNAAIQK
jgi:uncharacterized protein (DUF1800 family)